MVNIHQNEGRIPLSRGRVFRFRIKLPQVSRDENCCRSTFLTMKKITVTKIFIAVNREATIGFVWLCFGFATLDIGLKLALFGFELALNWVCFLA